MKEEEHKEKAENRKRRKWRRWSRRNEGGDTQKEGKAERGDDWGRRRIKV
jgi:hypothetical protein